MDFTLDAKSEARRQAVRAFVQDRLIPLAADRASFDEHENIAPALPAAMRAQRRSAGLWCLQPPEDVGGPGLPYTGMAARYEGRNRSIFGPVVFNSAAPDDGNMMLLNKVGTPAQKERWMPPVARGELR